MTVTIVGAGILGLATARAFQQRGVQVTVLEAEDGVARHQTGHNSGVIHSGLYYAPGSLKARLCTEGREALYRLCEREDVPHRRTGKLVVATSPEELPRLAELERRGRANGLDGIERWSGERIAERFPAVSGVAGLWVPQTGLVDFSQVARVLAEEVRRDGGTIRTGARLFEVRRFPRELALETTSGPVVTSHLVTCAGLQSDRVARLTGDDPEARIVPFRGEYYEVDTELVEKVPVPVYPVPDPRFPFLGVHLTPTVHGSLEAGPNAVLALARHGYRWTRVGPKDVWEVASWPGFWRFAARHWKFGLDEMHRSVSKRRFVESLRRLVPEIALDDVRRGGAGVRAQALDRSGRLVDDFRFAWGDRTVHVVNAPSPAATASLAIGAEIARLAGRRFGLAGAQEC